MSDLHRRDFLILMALAVAGSAARPALAAVQAPKLPFLHAPTPPELKGSVLASAINEDRPGRSRVFNFNLETGKLTKMGFDMVRPHDAIKIGDQYIALPRNAEPLWIGNEHDKIGRRVDLGEKMAYSGHALHDEKYSRIIITVYDRADYSKGYFVLMDPKTLDVTETIPSGSYGGHDLCFLDEDTIALCAYNTRTDAEIPNALSLQPDGRYSYLVLYDRETLKPKQTIQAYGDAIIAHLVMSKDKQLFAIGNQQFNDDDIPNRTAGHWEKVLKDFFMKSQPELKDQYIDIIKHIRPSKFDIQSRQLGLPLPNLVLPYGASEFTRITDNPQHHRRAQSICYNATSDAIGISYPNTDGIMIIDASTHAVKSLNRAQTGLREVRGITAVEDSPYFVAAGKASDFAVIDSRTAAVVKQYEAQIGNITHLHHTFS